VVSDANAVKSQVVQHYAADNAEAGVRAITAGNDMEMAIGANAFATLAASVRAGRLAEADLDRSVRRILIAKLKMGLFENPYVDDAETQRVLTDPAHRDVAQEAAERTLVLLKNDNAALPLAAGDHQRVAVIGPLA